uniref:Translation elongation factor EF1B beta/delta subunit guanine nucleotide exchange domain-containing protein n=1 Tax=Salix viminalis TaxID=40686 RepID=A0A6N2MQB0_SALVM
MTVTFSDLHTESGLKSLNEYLSGKSYISGDQISKDDIKVYGAVLVNPGGAFPNAGKWYDSVSSQLASSFPGKACGVRVGAAAAAPVAKEIGQLLPANLFWQIEDFCPGTSESIAAPTIGFCAVLLHVGDDYSVVSVIGASHMAKILGMLLDFLALNLEAAGDDDDDDLDLFGDETEEDKKAAEEREKAKKQSAKKKESGKSSVLLDVKPWDDETDMAAMEKAVRSIEMPGLLWGASKLAPVGYGIKKLQIMLTIVDDLVSVDSLIEEYLTVEPCNEYIQSCDIVAFNKI